MNQKQHLPEFENSSDAIGFSKYVTLVAMAGFVVALDQLTKLYVHTHYLHGESTQVVSELMNITYVRNHGAAFGFLANSAPLFRETFFFFMPPVALLIILLILRNVPRNDNFQILALSSIFGGALGNYVDRLKFRYVVDFIEVEIPVGLWAQWLGDRLGIAYLQNVSAALKYIWPAFNIADAAIVSGIFTIFLLMLIEIRRSFKNTSDAKATSH